MPMFLSGWGILIAAALGTALALHFMAPMKEDRIVNVPFYNFIYNKIKRANE